MPSEFPEFSGAQESTLPKGSVFRRPISHLTGAFEVEIPDGDPAKLIATEVQLTSAHVGSLRELSDGGAGEKNASRHIHTPRNPMRAIPPPPSQNYASWAFRYRHLFYIGDRGEVFLDADVKLLIHTTSMAVAAAFVAFVFIRAGKILLESPMQKESAVAAPLVSSLASEECHVQEEICQMEGSAPISLPR